MPDPQGLDVHDIQQTEQTVFLADGSTVRMTLVRFSIGKHGPFTLSFEPGAATADAVRAAIQSKQADLRRILELEANMV